MGSISSSEWESYNKEFYQLKDSLEEIDFDDVSSSIYNAFDRTNSPFHRIHLTDLSVSELETIFQIFDGVQDERMMQLEGVSHDLSDERAKSRVGTIITQFNPSLNIYEQRPHTAIQQRYLEHASGPHSRTFALGFAPNPHTQTMASLNLPAISRVIQGQTPAGEAENLMNVFDTVYQGRRL